MILAFETFEHLLQKNLYYVVMFRFTSLDFSYFSAMIVISAGIICWHSQHCQDNQFYPDFHHVEYCGLFLGEEDPGKSIVCEDEEAEPTGETEN